MSIRSSLDVAYEPMPVASDGAAISKAFASIHALFTVVVRLVGSSFHSSCLIDWLSIPPMNFLMRSFWRYFWSSSWAV